MVDLKTVARAEPTTVTTKAELPSDSLAQLLSPSGVTWRPHDIIEQDIQQRLQSPYRYFNELRTAKDELISNLKILKAEVQEMGGAARIFANNNQTLEYSCSVLDIFLSHCSIIPHDGAAYENVAKVVNELQCDLGRLYAPKRNDYSQIAEALAGKIQRLSETTEAFFAYEARKYSIISYSNDPLSPTPLSIKFGVLDSMLGHPKGYIFDVDDCLVSSEESQREAWAVAIKAWATDQGFTKSDPDGVEKLIRTTRYCLAKDATSDLLRLLCDICDRRGFWVDTPLQMNAPRALELALTPYRVQALKGYVSSGKISFMPGALEILEYAILSEKHVAACSNSPQDIAIPVLSAVCQKTSSALNFSELFNASACVFGDNTPHRKPFPLMWLAAAKSLGIRPSQAVIFDNSLNNCIGASDLGNYVDHPEIRSFGNDLIRAGENFAGVVGITNGHTTLEPWRAWASPSQQKPVKVVVRGMNHILT